MTPIAVALQRYYAHHYGDRKLPWRRHGEPLVRVTLVEGLLATTQAEVVGKHYDQVFEGISTGLNWLTLPGGHRLDRLSPLGRPRRKLKALDAIAQALDEGVVVWQPALESYLGLGPHTAAMILLLHGSTGTPDDVGIQRVANRAASDGDGKRWVEHLVAAAWSRLRSATGYPPAYEVLSAVLDLGTKRCRADVTECPRCPVRPWCAANDIYDRQVELGIPDATPTHRQVATATEVPVVNLDCPDGEVRRVSFEAGWAERYGKYGETKPDAYLRRVVGGLFPQPRGEPAHDLNGFDARIVSQAIANQIDHERAWCRLPQGDGTGCQTAWKWNQGEAHGQSNR